MITLIVAIIALAMIGIIGLSFWMLARWDSKPFRSDAGIDTGYTSGTCRRCGRPR